ncbi:Ig-like domain-containing protein [Rhodococcus sp. NPDC058514]|uniref:Ig-like domain-containing protein n=1 Tax=Rhodococcus sp. NPDC058514 TaxID=3346532 RepID=UPI00365E2A27
MAKRLAARGLNPGIVVEITDIQVEGGTNDEQITVGDSVTVSGTWDASAADPKAGDEFTVKFPDELKLDGNPSIQLKGDDGTVWGNCVLNAGTNLMNCVLTDAVTANPELVHGTFTVFTKAVEYTTSEEVEFEINGEGTLVDLPGEGGISDGKDLGVAKKSGQLQPDKQAVRWTIDIPGSDLAALDPGKTGSVKLNDELSANMKLCGDGRLNAKLLSGRPGVLKEVPGGVTITQDAAGDPVIIDINNGAPFEKDKLYRIEYTSCSTSGTVDPKDTQYNNSIAIGDETVGAGVGQDWEPTTAPSKSGKLVNGNGERYRVAEWTVMVPGSFIASSPDTKVTIADTLIGGHAVCPDGLSLKIEKSNYLPGPGGGGVGRTNVTDQFTIAESATPGAENFTVSLTPNDPFDAEQYYYVTYRTCVDGDKVPSNTDVFSNKALVNGVEVTASAKGPEFKGGKKGNLNTEPKEVGGEMQPAGTTIDWDAEVPGKNLEALTERAVITDTFSETLTVCDVSGDLKKDLNFRVVAKDSIGGKGAAPDRDLTADTIVTRTANGIEITLPKDAAAGDYSRETKYVIEYTLCTASGGLDDRGTVYGNALAYEGAEHKSSVTQTWGGSGTGEGVSRGSFSLLKQIDSASEKFPEGTEFTVKVEEFAPGVDPAVGPVSSTYEIKVKADGTPVSGLNPRGTGWTIRLSEVNLPQVDGVYFEQGKFRPAEGVTLSDGDTVALVAIEPKTNVEVSLVNKAVLGATTITKTVLNPENAAITGDESFVVKAEIAYGDGGSELREFTLKGGQSYELKDLPIGAKVTFTEVKPVNTDLQRWSVPVITP